MHDKTNFRSYLHRISSWMDPAATLLANPVNPILCTTKIGLITQSSQLYNIPLDGKTNFWSIQHRISSWISHLSGRQACPLHGKTNFRSNISIMQNLIELLKLLHLLHFYCNNNSIMQMLDRESTVICFYSLIIC